MRVKIIIDWGNGFCTDDWIYIDKDDFVERCDEICDGIINNQPIIKFEVYWEIDDEDD